MGAFESLECSKASSCHCGQHDDVFPSLMMERPKSQPSYLDWRSAAIIDLSATLKPQLQKNTSSDIEAVMHEAEQVRLRVEDLLSSDSVARLPKRLSFGGSTSSWPANGVGEGRSLACLGLYSTLAAVLVVIKSNHVSISFLQEMKDQLSSWGSPENLLSPHSTSFRSFYWGFDGQCLHPRDSTNPHGSGYLDLLRAIFDPFFHGILPSNHHVR